jgi:hypothetical protein
VLFVAINGYPFYGTYNLMRAAKAEHAEPITVGRHRRRIVLIYPGIRDADMGGPYQPQGLAVAQARPGQQFGVPGAIIAGPVARRGRHIAGAEEQLQRRSHVTVAIKRGAPTDRRGRRLEYREGRNDLGVWDHYLNGKGPARPELGGRSQRRIWSPSASRQAPSGAKVALKRPRGMRLWTARATKAVERL